MRWGIVWIADSFFVLLAVVFLLDGEGIAPWFLLAAAVHEAGHILAIVCLRGRITQFHISCAGGVLQYQLLRETTLTRAIVALAGPLFGAGLCWLAVWWRLEILAGASLLLTAFNLLPVSSLDGAVAVQAVLPSACAQQGLSQICLAILMVAGIVVAWQAQGFGLLFIALTLAFEQVHRAGIYQ